MDRNTEPFPSKEIRQMPDAFQIFTGCPSIIFCSDLFGQPRNLPNKMHYYFVQ